MAKKNKIPFNRSERLLEVDSELDAAMETLDETNQRVDGLLAAFEKPDDSGEEGACTDEAADQDALKPEDTADGEEAPEDASAPE